MSQRCSSRVGTSAQVLLPSAWFIVEGGPGLVRVETMRKLCVRKCGRQGSIACAVELRTVTQMHMVCMTKVLA